MSKFQLIVWGKRNMPLHKVGIPDRSTGLTVGAHLHIQFPNNFVELIDKELGATPIRFHGSAVYTWVPKGHQKRTRHANDVRSQGWKYIYGSHEKPSFMSRVGKGDMDRETGRRAPNRKSRGSIDYQGLKQSQGRFVDK